MKKVLIVIMDMGLGGAQKSLQTFLQCMDASALRDRYRIQLMVVKPTGALMSQIPDQIEVVEPPIELRWLGTPLKRALVFKQFSWRGIWGKLRWICTNKMKRMCPKLNKQQRLWECWKQLIPNCEEVYDVAVSYIDGFTNYYVMDKVPANKKVLWVHNEYQQQNCDPFYDRRFYEECDRIITISEKCRQCIVEEFPQCEGKTYVLENITSYESLVEQSNTGIGEEFADTAKLKILSVGRLHFLKGFDMAIGAAKLLRDAGEDFLWLVIGEGPDRQRLQALIEENNLTDHFRLIGSRDNPYAYMKACDLMVQPSRSEGKSIVLDEAKMLCKPIVVTNYTTINDSIQHGVSGWIVDMTETAIFDGIRQISQDQALRERICEYLRKLPKGNEEERKRYEDIMFSS